MNSTTNDTRKPNRDHRLHVMFLTTSMPMGGAETLLVNLVRGLDRARFAPEVACLKERGPLGEELATEVPVYCHLLRNKLDLRVLPRLWRLLRSRQVDAVVTVGAGDKMFWGRLAARLAGVPVIVSALHSTGWPDSVGRLNRLLTPVTDGFVGVADAHAEHLITHEHLPREKVYTIYNGVDTDRFSPRDGLRIRQELGLPAFAPVVGILAALRPEKNHELFLAGAVKIQAALPDAHFLVIGDGPRRSELQQLTATLGIAECTHLLGSRSDVPDLLSAIDVLALTSHNEASPVSVLEALSCGVPVVAAKVGSVPETVVHGETGLLFADGDVCEYVEAVLQLLNDVAIRRQLGKQGRARVIEQRSLTSMIRGYESLLGRLLETKRAGYRSRGITVARDLRPCQQK